jgi:hypothetical protein
VTEQRYKAVLAVIADGRTVTEVAKDGLVIPCVPGALYKSGKSRPQRVVGKRPKSGVCITIIPVARGLPQALAAVRDCASQPGSTSQTKEVWPRLTTAVP